MTQERPPWWARAHAWLQERSDLEALGRIFSFALLYGALDERLSLSEALKAQLSKPVPRHAFRHLWCMGGISLLLFINQVITGILLLVYYKPGPGLAYDSVQHIMNEIPAGWVIRQAHTWGSHLLVVTVCLHMVKLFFAKAYRPPRELNWVVGVMLLFMTFTFAFTGQLLPWDQRAYWGVTVCTDIVAAVPLVGKYLLLLVRGGESVGDVTLSRFFAVHCAVLPWVMTAFLVGHFVMIRRQGISGPY